MIVVFPAGGGGKHHSRRQKETMGGGWGSDVDGENRCVFGVGVGFGVRVEVFVGAGAGGGCISDARRTQWHTVSVRGKVVT